ncbi:MAG: hypothetical protein L0Z55_12855, partial [Planctomycetes bacterium]|nr:hypothetical protein [Planctomycetota bacterium]
RSAIGLGLLYAEADDSARALEWLERAVNTEGASPRWVRNAVALAVRFDEARMAPELERIETLKSKVARLATEHERLQAEVAARDQELARMRELYVRFDAKAAAPAAAADGTLPIVESSEAALLLDQVKEGAREEARARLHFARLYMERGLEHYCSGRHLHALNEARKALDIDPERADAQDLSRQCLAVIAGAAGGDARAATSGDGAKVGDAAQSGDDKYARLLHVEGMKAHLHEGRRLHRQGKTPQAQEKLERVLSDFAWGAFRLTDEEIVTVVEPAEHLLRKILGERGDIGEAAQWRGRESDLLGRLRDAFKKRAAQEIAFERLDALIEAMKASRPEEAEAIAEAELTRSLILAGEAETRGAPADAETALRDVVTLIEFFPALDATGAVAKDAERRLAAAAAALKKE